MKQRSNIITILSFVYLAAWSNASFGGKCYGHRINFGRLCLLIVVGEKDSLENHKLFKKERKSKISESYFKEAQKQWTNSTNLNDFKELEDLNDLDESTLLQAIDDGILKYKVPEEDRLNIYDVSKNIYNSSIENYKKNKPTNPDEVNINILLLYAINNDPMYVFYKKVCSAEENFSLPSEYFYIDEPKSLSGKDKPKYSRLKQLIFHNKNNLSRVKNAHEKGKGSKNKWLSGSTNDLLKDVNNDQEDRTLRKAVSCTNLHIIDNTTNEHLQSKPNRPGFLSSFRALRKNSPSSKSTDNSPEKPKKFWKK